MGTFKRRFGDRYDGRRIRTIDPFFWVIPHIMKTRAGKLLKQVRFILVSIVIKEIFSIEI